MQACRAPDNDGAGDLAQRDFYPLGWSNHGRRVDQRLNAGACDFARRGFRFIKTRKDTEVSHVEVTLEYRTVAGCGLSLQGSKARTHHVVISTIKCRQESDLWACDVLHRQEFAEPFAFQHWNGVNPLSETRVSQACSVDLCA